MTSRSSESAATVRIICTASMATAVARPKASACCSSYRASIRSCMYSAPRRIGIVNRQTIAIFQLMAMAKTVPMVGPLKPPMAALSLVMTLSRVDGLRPADWCRTTP